MMGIALALLFFLLVPPAAAQRSLAIERFDALITVGRDGGVDVTETITAKFTGSWNGIYRTVPVEYHTPQGFNWTLKLRLLGASGADGQSLKVEGERDRHYLKYKIWVPGAADATRTLVLRYRAKNGLRFFEDHDELYWNVTGDEWDVPIGAASARIVLPAGATGVRAIAFNGAYGSTAQDAQVAIEGTAVRVVLPQPLGFHEGLTAVVGWDKGLVAEPTDADRVLGFLASNWPLGIPVVVLLGMFAALAAGGTRPRAVAGRGAVRHPGRAHPRRGRHPDRRIGRHAGHHRDSGGPRGARVPQDRGAGGEAVARPDDPARLRLPPAHAAAGAKALENHESRVLDGIFESGSATVKLSDLDNEFYQHLSRIRESIFDRLVGRGLYRSRPDKVKGWWLIGAVVLGGVILGFGSSIGAAFFDMTPLPFVIAAVASGLIVAAFGRIMPARTVQGARALERVLGFEEFLRRVEGDRLERVVKTPEMFERFLPFAMAFGVERKWAKAFQDIYREPPTWYVGSHAGPFDLNGFSSRLGDLSSRAESAMSSSPRSSGGSGFSGGSSGGGSGGGGGGGF